MSEVIRTKMSKELFDIIDENLGYDVANVYMLIMGTGDYKTQRLLRAVGEKILMRHDYFFRNLLAKTPDLGGLKELHTLILTALNTKHENTPATPDKLFEIPIHKDVKDIKASIRISSRESVSVKQDDWTMTYLPDGSYYISKEGRQVAAGKYDAIIADSYNDQMTEEDREENLTRDLVSWIEKAIKGKVTD